MVFPVSYGDKFYEGLVKEEDKQLVQLGLYTSPASLGLPPAPSHKLVCDVVQLSTATIWWVP